MSCLVRFLAQFRVFEPFILKPILSENCPFEKVKQPIPSTRTRQPASRCQLTFLCQVLPQQHIFVAMGFCKKCCCCMCCPICFLLGRFSEGENGGTVGENSFDASVIVGKNQNSYMVTSKKSIEIRSGRSSWELLRYFEGLRSPWGLHRLVCGHGLWPRTAGPGR